MKRHEGEAPVNTMDSALRLMAAEQAAGPDWPLVDRAAAEEVVGPPVFATDRGMPGDELGRAGEAAFLAELVLHKGAQTPFVIGLFGAPGAGKSAFLDQVLGAAERLAAEAAGKPSRFVSDVVVVPIDVAGGGDPETLLHAGLMGRIAATHPALAADLQHAGADPAEATRKADAALDAARRKLDLERETLDGLTGREVRLVDAVIDTPGSHVDAYARSKRSRLDRVQRQFGFGGADPVATYKDFLREAAESGSPLARAGMSFRALWAYKGQTRLIVTAVVLFALAYAVGVVRGDQASWLDWIRGLGDKAAPFADWTEAHLPWLGAIETLLMLLGVLMLLLNVIRAARFVLPLARGVDLLQQDLEGRRRDLASQIAHQTRRVDTLAAEVEDASRQASEAERRASRVPTAPARPIAANGSADAPADAGATFRTFAAMLSAPGTPPSPQRVVVAIDGLDALSSAAAAQVVTAAGRLLGEGCVCLVVVDQLHLMGGFSDTDPARASAQFARTIQLPYRVGAAEATDVARRAYAVSLIDGARGPGELPTPDLNPLRSALDAPWRPREAATVAALASFAGETPRAIKHYVNLYRVARADPRLRDAPTPVFTALAVTLALDAHGFSEDLWALDRASHGEDPGEATVLRKALAAAREASGQPVELGQAQRAMDVASSYTARMQQ